MKPLLDSQPTTPQSQRGAVLLISLVILLVLTLLGVSTMESTGSEMKMANRSRERLIAMQGAEAGLRAAETFIEQTGFSDAELKNTGCAEGTQNCFKSDCSDNGYCFIGTNTALPADCTLTATANPVWQDATLNVWNTNGRHRKLIAPAIKAEVRYIVEFLCYTPTNVGDTLTIANAHYLFRITSLATSNSGKSQVMLQSTYKLKAS